MIRGGKSLLQLLQPRLLRRWRQWRIVCLQQLLQWRWRLLLLQRRWWLLLLLWRWWLLPQLLLQRRWWLLFLQWRWRLLPLVVRLPRLRWLLLRRRLMVRLLLQLPL